MYLEKTRWDEMFYVLAQGDAAPIFIHAAGCLRDRTRFSSARSHLSRPETGKTRHLVAFPCLRHIIKSNGSPAPAPPDARPTDDESGGLRPGP